VYNSRLYTPANDRHYTAISLYSSIQQCLNSPHGVLHIKYYTKPCCGKMQILYWLSTVSTLLLLIKDNYMHIHLHLLYTNTWQYSMSLSTFIYTLSSPSQCVSKNQTFLQYVIQQQKTNTLPYFKNKICTKYAKKDYNYHYKSVKIERKWPEIIARYLRKNVQC